MSFDVSKTGFILPDNWQLKRIGDIADINARTIRKDNEPQNIHYIDISSVSTGRLETPKLMEYSSAPSRAKRILKEFDIIISTVRPNLRQYVLLQDIGKNWVASTGFCVISPHESSYAWYLYSVITSELFTEHLIRIADGGTYPTFNPKEIENAIIPWPDSDGLKAINHLIAAVEGKINVNIRMNETLEGMAQAIFKSWFVDFDPVRAKVDALEGGGSDDDARLAAMQAISGKSPEDLAHLKTLNPESYAELAATADAFPSAFTTSPLGDIPEGWEVSEIGEEVTTVGGGTPSTKDPDFWEGGSIHWTTPKDMSNLNDKILVDTERRITNKGLCKISSGLLPIGTVLMSSRAPVGYLAIAKVPVAINQGYIAMKCNKRISPEFVVQWCSHNMDEIKQRASGTTFAEISKKSFNPIPVIVPSETVLKGYTTSTGAIYSKIESLIHENRYLIEVRDSMLPKLLSGEISIESLAENEE